MILEVLDPTGHLTFTFDGKNPDDVKRAKQEFDRLKSLGYAFFANTSADAVEVKRIKQWDVGMALDVRQSTRTVAVPPLRGG